VAVSCHADDETDSFAIKSPCFIAEVLSPSTAVIDKREKLIAYKMIESLQEYVIVWEEEMRVELHRRHNDGWLTFYYTRPDEKIEFPSIHAQITVANIYHPLKFKK
jgi:Uma2 family endonuclease